MSAPPTPPARGFANAEFQARTARAQALMTERELDAMLLTCEADVRYFTGFLTPFWQSPTRPWFVVLPASGKPVAVVPAIGRECMDATWVDDVRTWSSPTPDDEGVSLLAQTVRECIGQTGQLGVPQGPETHLRMPLADFHRLQFELDGIEIHDATDVIVALRTVKSPAEIAKIEHICAVAGDAFDAMGETLRTGMSEIEIFRAFKTACLNAGADDVPYVVGGAGPGGYGDIISPASERPLQAGDVLILDTGAVYDGYYCDFDRNWAIGHTDDVAQRAYATLFEATEAGFAALRPGAVCADIFEAMNAVMQAHGTHGNDVGRLGHGLGMQLTEWPSFTPTDRTEIRPGMVLTLEPGMTFAPGKVMVHEENVVVTEDGPRWLTRRAPIELPVL